MNKFFWEEIIGFRGLYDVFIDDIGLQIKEGKATELKVKTKNSKISGERWFYNCKDAQIWRLIPIDENPFTGAFILKNKKYNCLWPEIEGIYGFGWEHEHVDNFEKWLNKEIKCGNAKEIAIREYGNYVVCKANNLPIGEKWYLHIQSNTKWSLKWPQFSQSGSFTKLDASKTESIKYGSYPY